MNPIVAQTGVPAAAKPAQNFLTPSVSKAGDRLDFANMVAIDPDESIEGEIHPDGIGPINGQNKSDATQPASVLTHRDETPTDSARLVEPSVTRNAIPPRDNEGEAPPHDQMPVTTQATPSQLLQYDMRPVGLHSIPTSSPEHYGKAADHSLNQTAPFNSLQVAANAQNHVVGAICTADVGGSAFAAIAPQTDETTGNAQAPVVAYTAPEMADFSPDETPVDQANASMPAVVRPLKSTQILVSTVVDEHQLQPDGRQAETSGASSHTLERPVDALAGAGQLTEPRLQLDMQSNSQTRRETDLTAGPAPEKPISIPQFSPAPHAAQRVRNFDDGLQSALQHSSVPAHLTNTIESTSLAQPSPLGAKEIAQQIMPTDNALQQINPGSTITQDDALSPTKPAATRTPNPNVVEIVPVTQTPDKIDASINYNHTTRPQVTAPQPFLAPSVFTTEQKEASDILLTPSAWSEQLNWESARAPLVQTGTVMPFRADSAPHIARQLVEVMAQATHRPIEIALSPSELGRVRMSVKMDDGKIAISILTERPETLDLMRRHIDQLGQTFRSMGYEQISFSFGQGTTSGGQTGNNPGENATGRYAAATGTSGGQKADITAIDVDDVPSTGIDIRL